MLIIATGEHGDRNAPGVLKRVTVASMWLLGVVLIAQLTATVTSSQTVQRLRSIINGPEDLPGKSIATVPGSTAADYLSQRRSSLSGEVKSGPDAIRMLERGEVQAVVFEAPTIQYWVAQQGGATLAVVGPVFRPEKLGIAVSEGSALRKRIDLALLGLYQDGTYEKIRAKWFGVELSGDHHPFAHSECGLDSLRWTLLRGRQGRGDLVVTPVPVLVPSVCREHVEPDGTRRERAEPTSSYSRGSGGKQPPQLGFSAASGQFKSLSRSRKPQ